MNTRKGALFLLALPFLFGSHAMSEEASVYPMRVIEAIKIALDDEYRAAAFYDAVIEKFGPVRPFINIVEAERRHAGRLEGLLASAGVEIPANPYLTGEKDAPEPPATLNEACKIGVDAEIENAALYNDKLLPSVEDFPDVKTAMLDLMRASQENHLPAFERCGNSRGNGRGHGRRG